MLLEQQVRRNDAEMEEEEFWQNELQIEQESERQLRLKLAELQAALRDCEAKLVEYLARVQVRGDASQKKEKQQMRRRMHKHILSVQVLRLISETLSSLLALRQIINYDK